MVTRRDTPNGRFYDVDGELYPSVTHILGVISKPALLHWAANQERELVTEAAADLYLDLLSTPPMIRPVYVTTLAGRLGHVRAHRRALERAGAIGQQTHALIEWTLRQQLGQLIGRAPRVEPPARHAFASFQAWADSVHLVPKYIEQTVYSRTHRYAGTMDLLAEVNGVLTLVDFKTGKAIYPEAHLQNAAYQAALAEMGHSVPAAGLIVRLPKVAADPDFELATVPPVPDLLPVFLAARVLWEWTYQHELAYQAKRAAETAPDTPQEAV